MCSLFPRSLRLRQICVHPCLIAEHMDSFRTINEIEAVKEREALNEGTNCQSLASWVAKIDLGPRPVIVIGRARREVGQAFVDRMLFLLKEKQEARIVAEKEVSFARAHSARRANTNIASSRLTLKLKKILVPFATSPLWTTPRWPWHAAMFFARSALMP